MGQARGSQIPAPDRNVPEPLFIGGAGGLSCCINHFYNGFFRNSFLPEKTDRSAFQDFRKFHFFILLPAGQGFRQ
jgi:hypothetical protein